MKKRFNKIFYVFIIFMFLLATSVFAVTFEAIEAPYSEEYKAYIELTDEEKSKILEPRKYNFSNENNSTSTALLENEKISLRNLVNVLKSSITSTATKFSLKDILSNNLSIRNQKSVNACWAFASISSLETNLALKNYNNNTSEKIYDFSERHMAYAMSQSFLTNQTNPYGYSRKVSDGGTYIMSTAYLTNGQGAISEADMPFKDTQEDIDISEIQNKAIQTTVNNVIWFNPIADVKNADETTLANLRQEIKEHVSTYGSVYAGIYAPDGSEGSKRYINYNTGAMYVDEIKSWKETNSSGIETNYTSNPNHAVSIIGWNDEYSKDNFTTTPNSDGAWIIKNSWGEKEEYTFDELKEQIGTDISDEQFSVFLDKLKQEGYTVDQTNQTISKKMGDNGLFYVSYEDATIYTNLFGIVSASDTKTYDNIYQVDELGATLAMSYEGTKTDDIYIANVFTRNTTNPEYLTSVGVTSFVEGTYEVYINPNGSSKSATNLQKAELTTGSEITLTAGYNTINLKKPYQLTGNNFVIALKLKHTEGEYTYLSFESPIKPYGDANASSNAGESFITFESDFGDDSNWTDIGDSSNTNTFVGNFCIKGITVNHYNGETSDPDTEEPGGDKAENNTTGGNTTQGNNTTGGNTTQGNNTTGGNTTEGNSTTGGNTTEANNTTGGNITGEKIPKNSDFTKAKAYLTDIKLDLNNANTEFKMKIEINNIQVDKLCDKYEHYFYICSDPNKVNISNSKWHKIDSFEKQLDGTYKIVLSINKEEQLSDITEESKNAYVYIKEIATNGTESSTAISNGMEITIDTSGIDIDSKEEGEKVVTYTPKVEQSKKTTDNTISSNKLPNTGIKTILLIIGVISIVLIISYIKYKNMKDI